MEHRVTLPKEFGRTLTYAVAECPCGAEWDAYYSARGVVWRPRNERAAACPAGKGRAKGGEAE